MRVIQTACSADDEETAEHALEELKQKRWQRPTEEKLDAIAGYILHSDLDEAAKVASSFA
jgi:hypothetical protein